MKTEFIALQRARVELLAILERRSRTPLDALAMAKAFLDDLEHQFSTHHGPPHDAQIRRRTPDEWWWLYIEGLWLAFTTVDRRHLFGLVRTITLVAAETQPPASHSPSA